MANITYLSVIYDLTQFGIFDIKKAIVNSDLDDGITTTLTSGDQISAQIRKAQVDQVPWMVVLGKKEEETISTLLNRTFSFLCCILCFQHFHSIEKPVLYYLSP